MEPRPWPCTPAARRRRLLLLLTSSLAVLTALLVVIPHLLGAEPEPVPTLIENSPSPREEQPRVVSFPRGGASEVDPAEPLTLAVNSGQFQELTVTDTSSGRALEGHMSPDRRSYQTTTALAPHATYRAHYTVQPSGGYPSEGERNWNTGAPRRHMPGGNTTVSVNAPQDGAPVGVGQPLVLTFSRAVHNKQVVQDAVRVDSSAFQEVRCRWASETEMRCRPQDFWAVHSRIRVTAQLAGLDLGRGAVGATHVEATMTTGDKQVLVADAQSKQASLYINDQLVKTMPAMLGRPTFPSPSGYLVVLDKEPVTTFRAASIGLRPGDPDDYGTVQVHHAMRTSVSGYYIHEALPNVRSQIGRENLTHGCVGVSSEDATYLFDTLLVGSVVQDVHTPHEAIEPNDGFGDWNLPWEQWTP